jgi:hypothetical protein
MARGLGLMGMLVLTGCAGEERAAAAPAFLGSEAIRLTDDLVNIRADSSGGEGARTARDYADCVAAGHAVSRGFGFARHVTTTLSEEGGIWRADAVYTLSPAIPEGVRTIDAETKVAACGDIGIPTV